MDLITELQERGYLPGEDDDYDLVVSGIGAVRVVRRPGDDYAADVYAFDKYRAMRWSATFTPGTPDAAVLAVMTVAEGELAAERGGPVT